MKTYLELLLFLTPTRETRPGRARQAARLQGRCSGPAMDAELAAVTHGGEKSYPRLTLVTSGNSDPATTASN